MKQVQYSKIQKITSEANTKTMCAEGVGKLMKPKNMSFKYEQKYTTIRMTKSQMKKYSLKIL